jgi:hypothetical protein
MLPVPPSQLTPHHRLEHRSISSSSQSYLPPHHPSSWAPSPSRPFPSAPPSSLRASIALTYPRSIQNILQTSSATAPSTTQTYHTSLRSALSSPSEHHYHLTHASIDLADPLGQSSHSSTTTMGSSLPPPSSPAHVPQRSRTLQRHHTRVLGIHLPVLIVSPFPSQLPPTIVSSTIMPPPHLHHTLLVQPLHYNSCDHPRRHYHLKNGGHHGYQLGQLMAHACPFKRPCHGPLDACLLERPAQKVA